MKKILLIFVLLTIASSINAFGQSFTAKDGLSKATSVANATGIPNLKLFMIGTLNGKIPDFDIPVTFDLTNGTANVWAYAFRSETIDTTIVVGVIRLGIYIGYPASFSSISSKLPITLDKVLGDIQWNNSDWLSEKVINSQAYIDLKANHPDMTPSMLGLGVNPVPLLLDPNKPYWAVMFTTTASLQIFCYVQAQTGDVNCVDPGLDVDGQEPLFSTVEVYPNPSPDAVYVRIPAKMMLHQATMEVYGEDGGVIIEKTIQIQDGGSDAVERLDGLCSGKYFVRITSGPNIYSGSLTIVK